MTCKDCGRPISEHDCPREPLTTITAFCERWKVTPEERNELGMRLAMIRAQSAVKAFEL